MPDQDFDPECEETLFGPSMAPRPDSNADDAEKLMQLSRRIEALEAHIRNERSNDDAEKRRQPDPTRPIEEAEGYADDVFVEECA